jgi:Type IIA topoisomerase (DNA gyrase/topo II, topoisomerase IV), A subunit
LAPGVSSDKTIDALYAFTDCEVSVSPNCCVIKDNKPCFMSIGEVLKYSVDNTKDLFKRELGIQREELLENLMYASLEKIFIEERIYKDKGFEESRNMDEAVAHIDKRLDPFKKDFIREVTRDDILRLMEIKMARILKFNSEKANDAIAAMKDQVNKIDYHLAHLVAYTIAWYEGLKKKYGEDYPRRTEIRVFDTIEAAKVAEATEKLYINREEGFIGTGLKKDEYVCPCSNMDDIILFYKDGRYKVVKVSDKIFVGKDVLYLSVFKKNDKRTIYNVIYRDGKKGINFIKRFAVNGVSRDKEYDLTQGKAGSKILYFTANPNAESEVVKVYLKPAPRLKKVQFDEDFGDLAIKGRQSRGNILSKNEIHRIVFKQKGASTLGGREVWFDRDVLRLNYDQRGDYLGEFRSEDHILIITKTGEFYTTNFDLSNHFEDDILVIENLTRTKYGQPCFSMPIKKIICTLNDSLLNW